MSLLQKDFGACVALAAQRKEENRKARARCRANLELCAELTEQARRRGRDYIDWSEYFRGLGIYDPEPETLCTCITANDRAVCVGWCL